VKYLRKSLIALGILIVCFAIYTIAVIIHDRPTLEGHKTVICIPVYGQSYALGEEAKRITNYDSLRINYDGRIVTEKMNYVFGYFDHSSRLKQFVKRLLHYDRKAFELSVYGMAESLITELGNDTILCIFPGGHGLTDIKGLMKPVLPYLKFIEEIDYAYKQAQELGWDFQIPAVCWMQGESDIADYPDTDYQDLFHQMYNDLNTDIKQITHQTNDIRIICYQSSALTKGDRFKNNNYSGTESKTPEIQMELVRDDSMIWAMGPTYPYDFIREALHIDAIGQKRLGDLAAKSALGIIRNEPRFIGLVPIETKVKGNAVSIIFNVPTPPLCFDTVQVMKADHYGFNIIRQDNADIVSDVVLQGDTVVITCQESPIGCRIRYGVNGEFRKGGRLHGPRGNLRDSQGEKRKVTINGKTYSQDNWCYIFDYPCEPNP
jgi:hypothetical protein